MSLADYKQDLKSANEYKPDCAFHTGVRAVVTIRINGISYDVCKRCWHQSKAAQKDH